MKFSKMFVCGLLAAVAISAQLSSARSPYKQNNYGAPNQHISNNHNSLFDDDATYNNLNRKQNYKANTNNYQNQQPASTQTVTQAYKRNVNNCYGAETCNRAYPTSQAPSAQYNNNNNYQPQQQYNNAPQNNNNYHKKHSPYGTQKVLPAIYGGNGLFNYKGYARVPARAHAALRPAYGLSLQPIRALAVSGSANSNQQYSSHQVRRPIYHPNQPDYRAKRPARRQPRARRAHPRPHGPRQYNYRPQQQQHQPQYNNQPHLHTENCNHHAGPSRPQRYNGAPAKTKAPASAGGY